MIKTVFKSDIPQRVTVPSSKSWVIRSLFCAALCEGETFVQCLMPGADVEAAVRCLEALGAGIKRADGGFFVLPMTSVNDSPVLDCGESGAVLRFALPLVCGLGTKKARLIMHGALGKRPVEPLIAALGGDVVIEQSAGEITVCGKEKKNDFSVDCGVSSQFASGLLMMLSLCGGTLALTGETVSRRYIDMTLSVLRLFGAEIYEKDGVFTVKTDTLRSPGKVISPGDWSAAVPFAAAGCIGERGTVISALSGEAQQPDMEIIDVLHSAGARLRLENGELICTPSRLSPFCFSAKNAPDLVPCLAVAACAAEGESIITDAARLRSKESDRLESTAGLINSLGGSASVTENGLIITGTGSLRGGKISSCGDHRIAMAAACAAAICDLPVETDGAEAVEKSFPGFFETFNKEM